MAESPPSVSEESAAIPEAEIQMLEVHAPHQTIHTWKDFAIHITTIVIGLLIAIGLEQTVEWLHHRHQLRVAREQIFRELEQNRQILQQNLEDAGKIQEELARDMAQLRAYQGAASPMNAKLDYSWSFHRTPDAAWQAVRQNGSLDMFPYEELKLDNYLYTVFGSIMDAATSFNTQIEIAAAIAKRSPTGVLTANDTIELIAATSQAQGKLAFTVRLLGFEEKGLAAKR
jgi:hypothetical protein